MMIGLAWSLETMHNVLVLVLLATYIIHAFTQLNPRLNLAALMIATVTMIFSAVLTTINLFNINNACYYLFVTAISLVLILFYFQCATGKVTHPKEEI